MAVIRDGFAVQFCEARAQCRRPTSNIVSRNSVMFRWLSDWSLLHLPLFVFLVAGETMVVLRLIQREEGLRNAEGAGTGVTESKLVASSACGLLAYTTRSPPETPDFLIVSRVHRGADRLRRGGTQPAVSPGVEVESSSLSKAFELLVAPIDPVVRETPQSPRRQTPAAGRSVRQLPTVGPRCQLRQSRTV